jgi:two-component system CheB/CheR fusion protein
MSENKPAAEEQDQVDNSSAATILPEQGQQLPLVIAPFAFPVVGIGASAGGLGAFEEFFSGMPHTHDPGMAFVLVQHLSPDHQSLLSELIAHYTRMPVFEVVNGMTIEINCVYVIPPRMDMAMVNGCLRLSEPCEAPLHRLPIDFFFRSLAQSQRERAIGIVLTGTGSDGSLGVRAIKDEGGMVMAQSVNSAEFRGMPESAITTGVVDYQMAPADMPAQLIAYLAYLDGGPNDSGVIVESNEFSLMKRIFAMLRHQAGHDFSNYKQSTVQRRIERRMIALQVQSLDGYVTLLQQTASEVDALFRDLLIGVTYFFRDPQAFRVLELQVIPQLFENRPADSAIRTWTAGCSTGEEAYSLAILLVERMEALKLNVKLQLFASDVDSRAIATARAGLYPASIAADISPERLARFFTLEGNGSAYRIHKTIRDLLVFSEQDVIKDPPFSRLDLLTCRNLMIYMGPELQKKLIPLFHYALKPGGWLFLGSSESVGEFDTLFSAFEGSAKIYRHKVDLQGQQKLLLSRALAPMTPPLASFERRNALARKLESKQPVRDLMERVLLRQVTPASVLINAKGDILYVHGRTGNYLETSPGEAGVSNILKMAREGLRPGLSAMLRQAMTSQKVASAKGIKILINGEYLLITLSIQPVRDEQNQTHDMPLYLVSFEDAPVPAPSALAEAMQEGTGSDKLDADTMARISALSQELDAKDEYLQSTMEMLETYNEDLQSTTEEMQSSNEELQSVNEELATVNAELQTKVQDLSRANNDMNNLLGGTGIGTVFVDTHLRILSFTPAVRDIFNLLDTDVGRPVTNFVSNLPGYNKLEADVREVLRSLEPKQLQVKSAAGSWFTMRILPYRTLDNIVEGAVISFVDTSEMVATQKTLQRNTEFLERTGALAQIGGWELDLPTMKFSWSLEVFKIAELDPPVEPPLAEGINLFAPEVRPIISAAVQAAIDTGTPYDLELPIIGAKGRHGWVRTQGFADMHDGKTVRLFGTFQDITARKENDAARRLTDMQLERAFNASPTGMILVALDGKFIRVNPAFCTMCGWSKEELLQKSFQEITAPNDVAEDLRHLQDLIDGKYQTYEMEKNYIHKDGHLILVQLNMSAVRDVGGTPLHFVKQVQDITERRQLQIAQRASEEQLAAILESTADGIIALDFDGNILKVNRRFAEIWQISDSMMASLIAPDILQHCLFQLRDAETFIKETQVTKYTDQAYLYVIQLKDGRWIERYSIPLIGGQTRTGRVISFRDITERVESQQALQTSLKEKTALLFEVHHRVKNNLQVITSLLRLEAGRSEQDSTKAVLKTMQARIRAMATLHEAVHRQGTFAAIDLGSYIAQVARQSLQALLITPDAVQLHLDMGAVQVGLDQATPCGMLISELVSNSLKHGFPAGRTGAIEISLQPLDTPDFWRLYMSDNGIGFPTDFESKRHLSLGLQLVGDLATQMGGTLQIGDGPQAVFIVDFKVEIPAAIQINLTMDE